MALKRKITKEEFDSLNDTVKGEYKEHNGSYILDLEGDDEAVSELRKALEKERGEKTSTKAERDAKAARIAELELEIQQAKELDAAAKNGTHAEVQALQRKHTEALDALKASHKADLDKVHKHLSKAFAEQPAMAFANGVAKSPAFGKMLAREFGSRFAMEFDDEGNPTTVIKSADGTSNITAEDLTKEVYANAELADMLRPTGGSGGGADHRGNQGKGNQGLTETERELAEARRLGHIR